MRGWRTILFVALVLLSVVLFVVDLMVGDMQISLSQTWRAIVGGEVEPMVRDVVLKIRLTKAIVAVVAGVALSIAGLQMQTLFRNPLAEPYLIGVSAGAGLGVSLFLLGAPLFGAAAWMSGFQFGVAGAACLGAFAMMAVMMAVSSRVKDIMVVLVLGMMFGSAISAVVMILQYMSNEAALKAFMIWTMGSLGDVTAAQLSVMCVAVVVGLVIAVAMIKSLDMLLLGERYARTMGLRMERTRGWLLLSTTLLAGSVTAFCGPIGFVGLAIPHVARMLFRAADHRVLIPASVVLGAVVMLACDAVSKWLLLPINAITALAGIPIVVVVVLRNRMISE